MDTTLEMKEIEAAIEGILFASGEPVAVDRICLAMDMDRPTVELVLQKLSLRPLLNVFPSPPPSEVPPDLPSTMTAMSVPL